MSIRYSLASGGAPVASASPASTTRAPRAATPALRNAAFAWQRPVDATHAEPLLFPPAQHAMEPVAAQQQVAMPVAVGAENMSIMSARHPDQGTALPAHGGAGVTEAAPAAGFAGHGRSPAPNAEGFAGGHDGGHEGGHDGDHEVVELADWRARHEHEPQPTPTPSAMAAAPAAGDGEKAYMEQFAQRFAAARDAVQRVRDELPDVLRGEGEWSTPSFAPRAQMAASPLLAPTRPHDSAGEQPVDPDGEPGHDSPADQHEDSSQHQDAWPAPEQAEPWQGAGQPAFEPVPETPQPVFAPAVEAAPQQAFEPAPPALPEPVHAPAQEQPPAFDAVFAQASQEVAPEQPTMQPTSPANPDALAETFAPQAGSPPVASPVGYQPGVAPQAAMPQPAAPPVVMAAPETFAPPVAMEAPTAMESGGGAESNLHRADETFLTSVPPVAAALQPGQPEAAVIDEAARGFDWGGVDADKAPRKRFGRKSADSAATAADPTAETIVTSSFAEPLPGAPDRGSSRRSAVQIGLLFLVVIAIGLAAFQVTKLLTGTPEAPPVTPATTQPTAGTAETAPGDAPATTEGAGTGSQTAETSTADAQTAEAAGTSEPGADTPAATETPAPQTDPAGKGLNNMAADADTAVNARGDSTSSPFEQP